MESLTKLKELIEFSESEELAELKKLKNRLRFLMNTRSKLEHCYPDKYENNEEKTVSIDTEVKEISENIVNTVIQSSFI